MFDRLSRFGLSSRAIVRPHEQVATGAWKVEAPAPRGERLRIALVGVLANHKGAHVVAAAVQAADPATTEFRLIGYTEPNFPPSILPRLSQTGSYENSELPQLLEDFQPHVVWFPATWPETYSYTLSAALEACLPIVAPRIGAFSERLNGRPLTWLVEPSATAAVWLQTFELVREALLSPISKGAETARAGVPDFYLTEYLSNVKSGRDGAVAATPPSGGNARDDIDFATSRQKRGRRNGDLIDLRRDGRASVVIVPERLGNGALSPCAFIRLLQPFDHPAIGADLDFVIADAESARLYRADIFVTQRHAIETVDAADALAAHVGEIGSALVYDLDDDLLGIPDEHPESLALRSKADVVRRMLASATEIWVSTSALGNSLPPSPANIRLVENGLDERLWRGAGNQSRSEFGKVRILYMGTATHGADLALIEPALERLMRAFPNRVEIDIIGVTAGSNLPKWINRVAPSQNAAKSYPAFVDWITPRREWDIGVAPLLDTPFNRAKSAIKSLDYAALDMAVVASDISAYQGSTADGVGGVLVPNTLDGWYAALSELVRNPPVRRSLAAAGHAAFRERGTLASQAVARRAAIDALT